MWPEEEDFPDILEEQYFDCFEIPDGASTDFKCISTFYE